MDKYCIIKLENGLEVICKDVTNVFTKYMDNATNTVGTHKYRDLVTGTNIYCFVEEGKEKDKVIGSLEKFIDEPDALLKLSRMTFNQLNAYALKVTEAKNLASKRYLEQPKEKSSSKEYTVLILENGLEVICDNVTNVFTKYIDNATNTVGTQKYRDLVTGTNIYCFVEEGKERDKVIGRLGRYIASKDALLKISKMSDEDKKSYASMISNAQLMAQTRYQQQTKLILKK